MQGRVTLPRAQKLISQKLKNKDVRCAGKNPCTGCQTKLKRLFHLTGLRNWSLLVWWGGGAAK